MDINSEKANQDSSTTSPYNTVDMAVERTMMAADRSMMAWIRTGLSLVSFGFTLYKFLDYSREKILSSGESAGSLSSPRLVGLILIFMGLISLIFGIIEYVQTSRHLKAQFHIKRLRYSLLMAVIVMVFGLLLFIGVLFQFKGIS